MKKSLGLIETVGLAAGIEAADAAVKSANVELIGYELTMGGGWTTIKIAGDVGAVNAAVASAKAAASKVGAVVSAHVIARPSSGLDGMVINKRTLGSMPGARADVKGNSPLSASYVAPAQPKPAAKDEPAAQEPEPTAEPAAKDEPAAQQTEQKPKHAAEAPKPESGRTDGDSASKSSKGQSRNIARRNYRRSNPKPPASEPGNSGDGTDKQ